ncbi:MAG: hypothetical protein ACI9JN_000069 [Bacteroidia bacterium]|jgi:hypothetical protein
MSKILTLFLFGCITIANLCGCKSRKPHSDCTTSLTKHPSNVLSQVTENLADYDYLSLGIKANYTTGQNSTGFAMNVKMQKDSFVWVRVSVLIEVARAYITPDSFTVLDRINRKYYEGTIADLKQFTGQELSLSQLQDLFVANPLYAVELFRSSNDDLRNDHLQHQASGIINRIQLSGCFRSKITEFSSPTNENKVKIEYANFTKEKGVGYIPSMVNVDAEGNGKKYNLVMEYTSVSTTPFEPIRFKVPSKYEKGN